MRQFFLFLYVSLLAGFASSAQGQKVAVIGDFTGSNAEWQRLYEKAGVRPNPTSPPAEIRIYDLARPDAPPKSLAVGRYACAAFHRDGAELVVASISADWKSTTVQFFATDNGRVLRSFIIPDFLLGGLPGTGRLYGPRPGIRLAKVQGNSQFVLLGQAPSAARVGSSGDDPGRGPCAVAVFDAERLLGATTLPSTSALFATFAASTVSADGALIASFLSSSNGGGQQLSFFTPNDPKRPGKLLTELSFRSRVFTATQDLVYGLEDKLNLLQLPGLSALARDTLSPTALKMVEGVADKYEPLTLLPRGNGELLAFNALTKRGGVYTGSAQMLLIRPKEGKVQLGPKISDRFIFASLSSDGKRVVIVSKDAPQLVALSLPDLKVAVSIDAVMANPSEVVVE